MSIPGCGFRWREGGLTLSGITMLTPPLLASLGLEYEDFAASLGLKYEEFAILRKYWCQDS
jgi:hypothetical protein